MSQYPDVIHKGRRSVFPERLQLALETFQSDLTAGQIHAGLVRLIVDQLGMLPVDVVTQVEQEMPARAGLYRGAWDKPEYVPLGQRDQLKRVVGLEYVFLFHRNGYLREAALHKLDGRVPSPFLFAAVAYRLNDWVPPVRQAAFHCALRMFLESSSNVISLAAMSLLTRKQLWTRGAAETVILDEIFSRPEVVEKFVELLMTAEHGSTGRVLIAALSDERIDPYLAGLANKARQPAVRAVALRALLKRKAVWPEGVEKQWIDKSMGQFRMATQYKSRPLTVTEPAKSLILAGGLDKVVTVRKVAMQALVENRSLWEDMSLVIQALAKDRCAAIRTGADYIQQHGTESR